MNLSTGFPWHSYEISHKDFFKGESWWNYMNMYFSNIINKLGINESTAFDISKQIKDKYLELSNWYVYEDVIPCLVSTIRSGYKNIILSNHVPELKSLVKELGLSNYFTEIYSSANIGYEKPNIEIYKQIINRLGDSDITMIGDNYEADIKGALKAGINAILVRKENVYNYKHYCESLEGILEIIERANDK